MFVIVVMPKSTYTDEAEVQDKWCRYKVDHQFIDEDSRDGKLRAFEFRKVLYADDQASADLVAFAMAQENPGYDVCVLTPTSIFSSVKPEVVQKQVSDKGVLPF